MKTSSNTSLKKKKTENTNCGTINIQLFHSSLLQTIHKDQRALKLGFPAPPLNTYLNSIVIIKFSRNTCTTTLKQNVYNKRF